MNDDLDRSDRTRDELQGSDASTADATAAEAGGEPGRDEDRARAMQMSDPPSRITGGADAAAERESAGDTEEEPATGEDAVVGPAGTGGSGPGFVAPPPGTEWPDPLGRDDDERELARRTE